MSSLEDAYRGLLRWYPADHRQRHEDEMLGVLLAAAAPGQDRPTLRDRADLLLGAIEIRLSRALGGLTGGWRDALALVSVLAPVLLLAQQIRDTAGLAGLLNGPGSSGVFAGAPGSLWATWLGFLLLSVVIVAAVLRRARITAATLGWAYLAIWVAIWWAELPAEGAGPVQETLLVQSPLFLTVLALTLGPGPVRGLELIRVRKALLLLAVIAGALMLDQYSLQSSWLSFLQLAAPVVFAVIGGLAMARSATRRAALILVVPIWANVVVVQLDWAVPLTYLLPAIAFLAVGGWTLHRSLGRAGTPPVAA